MQVFVWFLFLAGRTDLHGVHVRMVVVRPGRPRLEAIREVLPRLDGTLRYAARPVHVRRPRHVDPMPVDRRGLGEEVIHHQNLHRVILRAAQRRAGVRPVHQVLGAPHRIIELERALPLVFVLPRESAIDVRGGA